MKFMGASLLLQQKSRYRIYYAFHKLHGLQKKARAQLEMRNCKQYESEVMIHQFLVSETISRDHCPYWFLL